jgi:predicted permease
MMEALMRHVRYSIRVLSRAPGFTATVVLTLALGIGANSAVFSAIDAVLLKPLPFPDGDRLMRVTQLQDSAETPIAPVRLEDWNRLDSAFEAITGYYTSDLSDASGELPERLRTAMVAPRFLDVLGSSPALGRGFSAGEHEAGASPAVLISDRYWRNRLGADPDVLGTVWRPGETAYSIVGVMPASFAVPDRDVDLWFPVPVVDSPFTEFQSAREYTWYTGIGRLTPGVTLEQARADLGVVQAQLGEQYPDTDRDIGVRIEPLKDTVVGAVRGSLWLVFGAVSVLLLIACTNIAALLLSRASRREQEIAVRLSLGATRSVVICQMLAETAVLVLAGAAAGLLVAAGILAALQNFGPDLPRLAEVAIDVRMLLYTIVSAVIVGLLCGLFPAVRSVNAGSLSRAGRTQVSARHSLQWLLVGVQVALSVTLLAGAGLLLRSFEELSRVDPGFDPARVLTFRVSGSYAETLDYDRLVQRINGTLDELRALPGVETAASSMTLPGMPGEFQREFELVEGRSETEPPMIAEAQVVAPAYFDALRIPLLAGELCRRPVDAAIQRGAAGEVMVNRRFADRYLQGRSVIGLQLSSTIFGTGSGRIVGIVGDAREIGIDREPVATVYGCFSAPDPAPWFLVRTSGDPPAVVGAIRRTIRAIEPQRSVYAIAPLEQRIGDAFAQDRLRTLLLVLFAVTALSLACLGIYGTLSYVVSLRRREVGLRVALGALSRNIVSQFVLKALRVVGVGCVAGLALSFAFTRLLSGMLYGVSPSDPITLSGVVVVVAAVAVLAALIPATRASRIDPMQALREE